MSSSIEAANEALGAYLDKETVDNIVVSAHGGTGGGSVQLNSQNPKAIGSSAIEAYLKGYLTGPANAKFLSDVNALQSVMGKLSDGGNFIVTGCQAGLGASGINFGQKLMELAGCRNINVFLNQDLSEQKYTYVQNFVPTGYASIVNYAKENGWGITGRENYHEGWLKFTPNEVAKNIGVLQLNADRAPYVNYKK